MIDTTLILVPEMVTLWQTRPDAPQETDLRWSLGPGWYEKNSDGLSGGELPPYLENPDNGHSTIDPITSDRVRRWATHAIAETTPYRVVGWDDRNPAVPILVMEEHRLIVHMTNRVIRTGTMHQRSVIRTLDVLYDVNAQVAVSETDHDEQCQPVCCTDCQPSRVRDTTIHIPVRSVVSIDHQVDRLPVRNAAP